MNRKHLCAVLAFGAATFATGALAADLPSEAPAPAPYIAPPPPVFTWTGFYIGVNAGANFNGSQNPVFVPNAGLAGAAGLFPGVTNTAGFTGGGQIGYNWQVSQFVFGLEGDADFLQRHNADGVFPTVDDGPLGTFTVAGGRRNAVVGSIRGRIGYAVDRALFYAVGGVAFGGNSAPNKITFANGAGVVCATCVFNSTGNTNNNIGELVGAGVEYAFTPNWTGRVEYVHTFYNNKTITYANGVPGQAFTSNGFKFDTDVITVGLNYKF
jgi:outer membrane immunogenic protein